jgi:hypothetical protein
MKLKVTINGVLILSLFTFQSQVSKNRSQEELNNILGGNEAKAINAQVFTMDVIVQGSLCVGVDCVSGESFGFDTERLKENNLRIHFNDTSTSGAFPTNDWRIIINDSGNGGANYFAVEDSDAGRQPFKIEAGARNNALYVDSNGDVGIGTENPVLELHMARGDSPGLRLEQDASTGFTPQTWDIAGNEASFFIRDVTNGSKLPFRIFPNAPTNAFEIGPSGVTIKNVSLIQPTAPSDLRLKESLKSLENMTGLLLKLYPKSYYFRKEFVNSNGFPSGLQYGLVAQEVEKVLPELVGVYRDNDLNVKYKSLNYSAFVPLLIQGFKEQQATIDAQNARITELEKEMASYASLELRVRAIEASKTGSQNNAKR